jgi:Ca2+/Na+ antiporter
MTIDDSTISLATNEPKDVLVTFKIKEDVSGDKAFNVELYSGNTLISTNAFSPVTIEESSSWLNGLTGFNLSEKLGSNWYLWAIGVANVVLILIIIIVAIKVARK